MALGKTWRLGGFVVALTASAGLVAAASSATGAYFTDVHPGTITANSGHLKVNITSVTGGVQSSGTDGLTLNFNDLFPADYRTAKINYTTDTSVGNSDLWLVFPTDTQYEQNIFDSFTGPHGTYNDGGLGRYGHFAVSDSHGGLAFSSYNLSSGYGTADCTPDAYGHATAPEGSAADNTGAPPCAVPKMIRLASNLPTGTAGTINVTFGLTQRQTQQNQPEFVGHALAFEIVATQPGVAP